MVNVRVMLDLLMIIGKKQHKSKQIKKKVPVCIVYCSILLQKTENSLRFVFNVVMMQDMQQDLSASCRPESAMVKLLLQLLMSVEFQQVIKKYFLTRNGLRQKTSLAMEVDIKSSSPLLQSVLLTNAS